MFSVLVILQVVIAVALISLVLLQQGKGADMGAAFGAGASGTVFGSRGSANFLSRTTAALAAAFFITSLVLAYLANSQTGGGDSITDQLSGQPTVIEETVPPEEKQPPAGDSTPAPAELPE